MLNIDWTKIPTEPGVYIWKGEAGQVLYIGKAKNLRNRMRQYFREDLPPKNKLMVKQIIDYEFQISASEVDSLILEEELINKFEPKYNIKIKSAKRYPYIELKNKDELTLEISRTLRHNKGSKYFGPFPDGFNANKLINILKSVLPLDKCLAPKSDKPCLNYEMGRCLGRCIGKINEQEKEFVINQVKDFFSGKTTFIENKLKQRIEKNNELLNFEESQQLVEKLQLISKINEQKMNTFKDTLHRDIFNIYSDGEFVSISVMYVRFGSINLTTNYLEKTIDTNIEDVLESFIRRFYKTQMIPKEIIVPFEISNLISDKVKIINPSSGTRKDILDVVYKHAKETFNNKVDSYIAKQNNYLEANDLLKKITGLNSIVNIEMVDISSTMGSEQVGAVVRFKDGETYKEAYRKYIIKSTDKMDDYASTEEVVRRHFERILKDDRDLPDVFIVDGKHQLSNAKKILSELGINKVSLVGLVKDDKHTTNAIIDDELQIRELDRKSGGYLFLNRLQDEVHRFVISFHRKRREKSIIESKLDEYTFLSEADKNNLFKEFKSIRKILTASETELRKVISEAKVKKFIKEK